MSVGCCGPFDADEEDPDSDYDRLAIEAEALRVENRLLMRELAKMRAALADMLSGWRYIRESHGDLYGVGWDRAQIKAEKELGLQPWQEMPAEWFVD